MFHLSKSNREFSSIRRKDKNLGLRSLNGLKAKEILQFSNLVAVLMSIMMATAFDLANRF